MGRLRTVIAAVLAAALVGGVARPTLAQGSPSPVVWRLAHYLPEEHFFARGWLAEWIAKLEAASGGRIKIEVHPNNTLLRLGAIAPGVRDGKAELGFGPAPDSAALEVLGLPFMVASAVHGTEVTQDLLADGTLTNDMRGLRAVVLHSNAPSILHTKAKSVRVPADLRGLRMRGATDNIRNFLSKLGAEPVAGYLAPQVYAAFQNNAIDGTVWPYEAMGIYNLGEQANFHLEVPFFVSTLGLFLSEAAYAAMPADLKAVVDAAAGRNASLSAASAWDAEETRGREIVVARGNTVRTPTAGELVLWRAAAKPFVDQKLAALTAQGIDAAAMFTRVQELAARQR